MSNVVIAGRGHCCDPFSALKEEIDMAVTIAMNARNIAEEALASTGAGASDNNPLPLDDTASPGSAMEWSRSDHVHPNTGLLKPDDVTAGDNIEITDNGDGTVTIALKADQVRVGNTVLTGNVTITGNITQNGSAYETHAEKVYTTNDYVIMREGATGALGSGDYSGFQVKLYDGVNDGRLVIDNTGTARVGDVGDEQPLLTREESNDLTDGAILKWDSANGKAVDEGTVGDDTHPLKSVNGVLTPVVNDLAVNSDVLHKAGAESISGVKTFTNVQGLRAMSSIPSYTSQSIGWGAGDIMFVGADGTQLGYLRIQQQGNSRSIYVGIADTAGNVSWVPLHTVTL